jgi:hypothetical protein
MYFNCVQEIHHVVICILLAIILIIRRICTFGGILMKPVWLRRPNFLLKWGYGAGVPLLYSHNKFQKPECKHCVIWFHSRTSTLIQPDWPQSLLKLNDYGSDGLLICCWRACISGQSSAETAFPSPVHSSDKFISSLFHASCQRPLKIIGMAVAHCWGVGLGTPQYVLHSSKG